MIATPEGIVATMKRLQHETGRVHVGTEAIARRLGVTAADVLEAIDKNRAIEFENAVRVTPSA